MATGVAPDSEREHVDASAFRKDPLVVGPVSSASNGGLGSHDGVAAGWSDCDLWHKGDHKFAWFGSVGV
jgi:hypothetical protein